MEPEYLQEVPRFNSKDRLAQAIHDSQGQGIEGSPGSSGEQARKAERRPKKRYSIRINDQYRIRFIWKNSDALEVEIVDYH